MRTPEAPSGCAEISRLQRWFQTVITHADGVDSGATSQEAQQLIQLNPGQLEKVVTRSRALTAAERLAIYANAYHTRLLECLGEVYPLLKRALGDEAFEVFAFGYLQEYPPRSYTLNELGRSFPHYLEETRPQADSAEADPSGASEEADAWPEFLIDLARLEWAIYEVFDGPGVEGQPLLSADALLNVPPERWAEVQFDMAPCLQLLATQFPVNDYYTRFRQAKDGEPVPLSSAQASFVALTRRQYVVRRYNLSEMEFELLRALQQGSQLGAAIDCASKASNDDLKQLAEDLKLWFRNWTAEGFISTIRLPESALNRPPLYADKQGSIRHAKL